MDHQKLEVCHTVAPQINNIINMCVQVAVTTQYKIHFLNCTHKPYASIYIIRFTTEIQINYRFTMHVGLVYIIIIDT